MYIVYARVRVRVRIILALSEDIGEADGRRLGLIFRQLTLKQAAPRVEGSQFQEEMR